MLSESFKILSRSPFQQTFVNARYVTGTCEPISFFFFLYLLTPYTLFIYFSCKQGESSLQFVRALCIFVSSQRFSPFQELGLSTGDLAFVFPRSSACGACHQQSNKDNFTILSCCSNFFLVPVREFVILYNSL